MQTTPPHWQRNIAIFLLGQFLSGITSMTVQYAIIWYLTAKTGSATILSIATLLGMLPTILLSPFVGPYIDRLNKKMLLIVPDIVAAMVALILSAVGEFGGFFPVWLIFVSLLVRALAQTFQMPTIQAILPTMVPGDQLTRVNGQLGVVNSANMIIAPALGAVLFGLMPMPLLILLDVLGAILGVSLLLFVSIPENRLVGTTVHVAQDAKVGWQLLRGNRGLWYMTLIGMLTTFAFMPAASMYPLMTMRYFHGTVGQAGLIEVVYFAGSLLGGLLISTFGHFRDRIHPIVWGMVVIGVTFGLSGVLPRTENGFLWFLILNGVAGLAWPFFNTPLIAMYQQSYAPETLGRVMGILNALMSLPGSVGLIFAGPIADRFGVATLFVVAGIGVLLAAGVMFGLKITREYDRQLQADGSSDLTKRG